MEGMATASHVPRCEGATSCRMQREAQRGDAGDAGAVTSCRIPGQAATGEEGVGY